MTHHVLSQGCVWGRWCAGLLEQQVSAATSPAHHPATTRTLCPHPLPHQVGSLIPHPWILVSAPFFISRISTVLLSLGPVQLFELFCQQSEGNPTQPCLSLTSMVKFNSSSSTLFITSTDGDIDFILAPAVGSLTTASTGTSQGPSTSTIPGHISSSL